MIRLPFLIRRIVGESMLPLLHPNQVIVVARTRHVRPGELVLFCHQGLEKIKRVTKTDRDLLYVVGDNKNVSTDSRDFGWLPRSAVRGKIVLPRMHKRSR